MSEFIIQGNASNLNRGCEAITLSTIKILEAEFGPSKFVYSPHCYLPSDECTCQHPMAMAIPPRIGGRLSWSWINYQVNKRILGRQTSVLDPYLPGSTATLACGGDNMTLDYGNPIGFFETNRVTLRAGKPLILWGASIGPFTKNPAIEKLAVEELKRTTLIFARESETINYLASVGVKDNVRVVSDPAFLLDPQETLLRPQEEELLKGPCLGVNLSPLLMKYWNADMPWAQQAAQCLKAIIDCIDMPILLVPHVVQRGNNDYEFMKAILDGLPKTRHKVVLLEPYNCRQVKWVISRLAGFVGARMHATIAAFSTCVPTISVGYSMKARGVNKDIFGHLDHLLPITELTAEKLTQHVGRLLADRVAIKEHLQRTMPAYIARSTMAAKYVREVVTRS